MICKTCHRALLQGNIPAMASCNKLQVRPLPSELECLSELETRLIAKRIPFMKLMNLPSGKQKAVVGSLVNVPVDIVQTCASLPRSSTSDMGFIPLKLKRKKQYTGHVQYQMIRPSAVEKGLCYLQQNHKLYRDIDMNVLWQQEFENDNEQLWQALTVAENNTQEKTVENLETESDHESTKDNEQPTTYITTDKGQHASQAILEDEQQPTEILQDHDNNKIQNTTTRGVILQTSPAINDDDEQQPSTSSSDYTTTADNDTDELDEETSGNTIFSIAPGEGRLPTQILQDEDNEVLTFPHLFPTGEFGFDVKRDTKLTLRKYFIARLCNKDNRFATNIEYLFYAQFLTDFKQVSDSINIALRKATSQTSTSITAGQLKDDEYRKQLIQADKGYQFLQTVRGSPAYCKKNPI
ncbi:Hypothetical predicted protein [Mytilus galloprovincialis]|uniref:DUF6570 domain-containing protein n=1 Tax=Mytilus galloprovincialis TaxID=29158 RepID=A0A8B6HD60_MYTGA|nr:Hypothetical predicted protein [Mytilus galloprovincialis]